MLRGGAAKAACLAPNRLGLFARSGIAETNIGPATDRHINSQLDLEGAVRFLHRRRPQTEKGGLSRPIGDFVKTS